VTTCGGFVVNLPTLVASPTRLGKQDDDEAVRLVASPTRTGKPVRVGGVFRRAA
jgi:hypothetical protein